MVSHLVLQGLLLLSGRGVADDKTHKHVGVLLQPAWHTTVILAVTHWLKGPCDFCMTTPHLCRAKCPCSMSVPSSTCRGVALPVHQMQQCWLQFPRQVTPAQHMVLPFRKPCLCIQATVRSCSHASCCENAGR